MCWAIATLISFTALVWSTVKEAKVKRAMQWWFQRQTAELERHSDHVHNGLMQDLFAVRRSMETAEHTSTGSVGLAADRLAQVENIYSALEQLSCSLSPAYTAESLPLAIQARLRDWEEAQTQSSLSIDVPSTWNQSSMDQNHLIMHALDSLLDLADLPTASIQRVNARLSHQGSSAILSLQLGYPTTTALKHVLSSKNIEYLRYSFNVLSNGTCSYYGKGQGLFVTFQWQS